MLQELVPLVTPAKTVLLPLATGSWISDAVRATPDSKTGADEEVVPSICLSLTESSGRTGGQSNAWLPSPAWHNFLFLLGAGAYEQSCPFPPAGCRSGHRNPRKHLPRR